MATISFGANDGTTNGTATVVVVPSPSSGVQRIAKSFKLNNADSVTNTFIYGLTDGVNFRQLYTVDLDPGDTIQMNENDLDILDTTSKSIGIRWLNAVAIQDSDWEVSWCDQVP